MPNLHEEFPVIGELEHLPVVGAISGNPYVICLIDMDAVLHHRPVVARTGTTPRFKKIAFGIKFQHWGRRKATFGSWRRLSRAKLVFGGGTCTLQNPDMIVPINGDCRRWPHHPIVGQLLWPGWVDLIGWGILRAHDGATTNRKENNPQRTSNHRYLS